MDGNKRIGLCTLYTGYNYGSALQAFALKEHIKSLNYDCDIIKLSGSIVNGRDFRLKKAFVTFFRMFIHSNNIKNVIKSYSINNKKKMNLVTINKFDNFYKNYINPIYYKYNKLKSISKTDYYYKFICGSDQIWNSTAFYVDPFYYLWFAPRKKKISYAPSFGRDFIPKYNTKKIKKYISGFDFISVREESGRNIIKKLLNKEVDVCLDPTFLLSKNEWIKKFDLKDNNEEYIFTYFLNEPSTKAKKYLRDLSKIKKINFLNIGRGYNQNVFGGPKDFLTYIYNSSFVVTDSFHGLVLSLIFNKNFVIFDREYATENQSTRIVNLLEKINLLDRFNPNIEFINKKINYKLINNKIKEEIIKSKDYLNYQLENEYEK